MEVEYSIVHHPLVVTKDIPQLDAFWRREIRDAVRSKLTAKPEIYGIPLSHTLKGFRKLRVGDYRVIYQVVGKKVRTLIIDHRSRVYKKAEKRLSL